MTWDEKFKKAAEFAKNKVHKEEIPLNRKGKDEQEYLMNIASRDHYIEIETKEIIKKAKEESDIHYIMEMSKEGLSVSQIAKISRKPEFEVKQIIDIQQNK